MKTAALKEKDMRALAACICCGRLVGQTGIPIFNIVTIERHGLDVKAVSRQAGLEAQLGGNSILAQAMGPNEDFTIPLGDTIRVMVCNTCSCSAVAAPACIAEIYNNREGDAP
jgi:hypothetical protein